MVIRVLGPIEVDPGVGTPARVTAMKERRLLAALVARRGQIVTVGQLVEALWGDAPPRTAPKTLQTYVLGLRRLLPPDAAIETTNGGYRLAVAAGGLDVDEFERLVDAGRAAARTGDPAAAATMLGDALGLWRGPAYGDVADDAAVGADHVRLEELRLAAIEARNDAELVLGRHDALVAPLEVSVATHPLREQLWAQLVLALYRTGRQADALRAVQRARRLLAEELGIEPGPELRRLERAVLDQDPSLDPPTSPSAPTTGAPASVRTSYARAGDVHLAYQVVGAGAADVLLVPDWYSHLEALWEHPQPARLLRELGTRCRLIVFDSRGTGMSDPVDHNDFPTLEQWADDADAVLDAAGSERAFFLGASVGAAMALLYAATRPDRVRGLILLNPATAAAHSRALDMGLEEATRRFAASWGRRPALVEAAPSLEGDAELLDWFGRYQRLSLSPGGIRSRLRMAFGVDVDAVARGVQAPTLVLHRAGNRIIDVERARELAASMPRARFVTLPGADHLWMIGALDPMLAEVEAFLDGEQASAVPDRVLSSVLVIDVQHGGAEQVDRFRELVRRHVARYRGVEHREGVASFDGPARAIACAVAVAGSARQLGLDLRAGVHTGEVERRGEEIDGVAVAIAAHVAAAASPGEVLVSRTVVDLVAGSGLQFEPGRACSFPDLPGPWELHAVVQ